MKKKGQLTIIVIIAIVIVLAIIIYTYIQATSNKSFEEKFFSGIGLSQTTKTIRTNILDCVDITTNSALIAIGVQGGNYYKPEKYIDLNITFLSFYYYEGEYFVPTNTQIENAISNYINENLKDCLNEKEYPREITFTSPITTTRIQNDQIIFNIDSKITIKDDSTTRIINLKESEFKKESLIYGMIEIADYLTNYHKIDPKYYCINCLSAMAYERGLNVDIFPFVEDNIAQVMIHENKTNNPSLTVFTYLNKYTGDEKSPIFDE